MQITWNGTSLAQERNEGYKVAEDEIYNGLINLGLDIDRTVAVPRGMRNLFESGLSLGYATDYNEEIKSEILISNRLPIDYSKCDGYNIGFSYWETNKLPKDWVERMNSMDEIWTTSEWAKNVFINSGVSVPVYAFNLGVNDYFKPVKRTKKFNQFTFLSIGSPSTRKNSQMTVDAFLKLFDGKDNVSLLYKTMDAPDARIRKNGQLMPISCHNQIKIVDRDLPMSELAELYDSIDCVVYPTSGEGWGMLPFQGIAKGIPTICTNATACTEYADMSVPLDFNWGTMNISGVYQDTGTWAEPDFDDLCDKMLYVYNNYEEVAEYTYNNAVTNYSEMRWETVVKEYHNRLCQISSDLKAKH